MKFVIFPAVDYDVLVQFIQNLDFRFVDNESFENLKKIFYLSQEIIPMQRWSTMPILLSLDQFNQIVTLLNTFFQENTKPIEKLEMILFNYKEYEIQNSKLKNHFQSKMEVKTKTVLEVKELNEKLQKAEAEFKCLNLKNESLELELKDSESKKKIS
jgi:hypothetical protein